MCIQLDGETGDWGTGRWEMVLVPDHRAVLRTRGISCYTHVPIHSINTLKDFHVKHYAELLEQRDAWCLPWRGS